MIALHRIVRPDHDFYINPDLIQMVEANPDTCVTLTNGSRFVIAETPAEVAELVSAWRGSILAQAVATPLVANNPRAEEALAQVLTFPLPSPQQS
jgi:flagellar protein FlbD